MGRGKGKSREDTDADEIRLKKAIASFANQYPGVADLGTLDLAWIGIADQKINMFMLTVEVNTAGNSLGVINQALVNALSSAGLRIK